MKPIDLRMIRSFDLSPDDRHLLLAADVGVGGMQPWLVDLSGGPAKTIELPGVVVRCSWHPSGNSFVAQTDLDGRENYRIALVSIDGHVEWLDPGDGSQNELGSPYSMGNSPFSLDGRYLAYASNRRDSSVFDVVLHDLTSTEERTVLQAGAHAPADRYFPLCFSPDSTRLLVIRLHQRAEQELFTVDLAGGHIGQIRTSGRYAKFLGAAWSKEGVYVCATRDENFTSLALIRPSGEVEWIDTPEHDIEGLTLSADGATLAWGVNRDGYSALRYCELRAGRAAAIREVSGLPPGTSVYEGGLDGYAPQLDREGSHLYVLHAQQGHGTAVWRVALQEGSAQKLTGSTDSERTVSAPAIVQLISRDNVQFSALLYRPEGEGPSPAVMYIHGGPEDQVLPVSEPMITELVSRGIAVIAPNARGSIGYGLKFQRLIYGRWESTIEDFRAAAELLRATPWIDSERIAVYGASYGGFAALCCLTCLPDYWRAGVSESGVVDLLDFIRTLPPTWRGRAAEWIGDIAVTAERDRLRNASPLENADALRASLLLVHGANDGRAAVECTDRLYRRLVELGKTVTFDRIEGPGHDIALHGVDVQTRVVNWLCDALAVDSPAGS